MLLAVGGGLGILKIAIEYVHTALENRNIILAAFYFVGVTTVVFVIGFCMLYIIGDFSRFASFNGCLSGSPNISNIFTGRISSFYL